MGRHAADAPPSRPTAALAALVAVALIVVVGITTGGIWLSRRDTATPVADVPAATAVPAPASTCATKPTPVAVAVAPAAVTVVKHAATRTTATNPCVRFTVTGAESADEAATLSGSGAKPAAWVSDSSVFVDAVRAAAPDVLDAVRPIATSPLVFALPSAVAGAASAALAAPSWSTLVVGDPAQSAVPVRLTDPEHSTSGRLMLLTASSAIPSTPATRLAIGKVLITWSHTPMRTEQDLLAAAVAGTPGLVPTSEQAVGVALRTHPGSLVAVIPKEGTGRYDYALATVSGLSAAASRAVTALGDQLTDAAGTADLTAAGFRSVGGTAAKGPGIPGVPSTVTYLSAPTVEAQAALLRTWTNVKTDARMLALIDTSGSMKEVEGTRTRIDLASEAAQTAVSIFPDSSQLGLWTFGIDKGGPGQDWQEVVPIRQLDQAVADAGGKPQRQVLTEALPALVGSASGGTGLYDSLLAAYTTMVGSYAPGRVNSVILLTDGKNENPSGLTLEQLLARIEAVKDPARPVVLITVGMGQGVDTTSLGAVAAVTGGKTYVAQNPQDIQQVFIDAVLSRDCSAQSCTTH